MRNRVLTDEVRAKLSQNITNYNLSKAHEVSVINVEENTKTVYESVRKAAASLNTTHATLSAYIKSGKLYKGLYKIIRNQQALQSLDGDHMYVGHSINLYNRISSYFMPSILKTKARRVLRYLNKHGFSNIKLTIYIMDENSSLEEVVELEQHFIDNLKPNLNVDLVASSSFFALYVSFSVILATLWLLLIYCLHLGINLLA